jgi:beta-N-acetylhexosaminidase
LVPIRGEDLGVVRDRVERGQIAGVILFARETRSVAATRQLVAGLQAAPRPAGLRASLLIAIDQEGGLIRRLPGSPRQSAKQLGATTPRHIERAGEAAGRLLAGAGVNVDLAPDADVGRPGGAIAELERSFGSNASLVATAASAFAQGLRNVGVAATAKHFPGLGAARGNTDAKGVAIRLSRARLQAKDELPFARLIARGIEFVMVSNAIYPALDPARPAVFARAVVTGELRRRLHFGGVVVTDDLEANALAGSDVAARVRAAAHAGADLFLIGRSFGTSEVARSALATLIASDPAAAERSRASVARILALRLSIQAHSVQSGRG